MTLVSQARRAALLGVALVAMACDLATFATDPKPILEQTWNLPAPSNKISVADLLPPGNVVTIVPDSSAFALTIAATNISRIVGNDCALCLTLNGTNAVKPLFTLNAGNSTALPQDVVSAAILTGSINILLTNNMSFDPLYVKTGPGAQGYMLIVVRSGSVVLGRDSVMGAATPVGINQAKWPPAPAAGSLLNRTIVLSTGTVTTNLTVDVTVSSPLGDHLEFINANGTLNASASVPSITVGSVSMNVPSRTMNSGPKDSIDLSGIETSQVVGGGLVMTIANPFTAVTGTLSVKFAYGPGVTENVTKTITIPSGTGQRSVTLDSAEIQSILGKTISLNITGSVTAATPILVTPKQAVSIDNRLVVTVRTGSGGN